MNESEPYERPLVASGQASSMIAAESVLTEDTFTFPMPKHSNYGEQLSIHATGYVTWPALEATAGVNIIDKIDSLLGAQISVWDFCNAADESTVRVTYPNGRTRSFSTDGPGTSEVTSCRAVYSENPDLGELFGKMRFRRTPVDAPFGVGSEAHWRLVPHRSIAVLRGSWPNGTLLFIPDLVGKKITLPDTTTHHHDGYVMVADVGKMRVREHIDYFLGVTTNQDPPFESKAHPVAAVVVNDPMIQRILATEHQCVCNAISN